MDGVFDRPLGAPLGDGRYNADTQTWHRVFTTGTKVTFDVKTNQGTIMWGGEGGQDI